MDCGLAPIGAVAEALPRSGMMLDVDVVNLGVPLLENSGCEGRGTPGGNVPDEHLARLGTPSLLMIGVSSILTSRFAPVASARAGVSDVAS